MQCDICMEDYLIKRMMWTEIRRAKKSRKIF